jgi:ammonium transporter, Amt family
MEISAGDTAWILTSAALVLLMTPGLAFFYGGMVRTKSVLNMIMMSFSSMGIVTVLWVLYGYSMAFGDDVTGGLVGDPTQYAGLNGLLGAGNLVFAVPTLAFVAFQLMFAIITVALISGAVADRVKFSAWCIFTVIWATIVYFPVAHMVFAFDGITGGEDAKGGLIGQTIGALDFAGGTAVHINAGAAGLALVLVLGKRVGWPKEPMRPHNLPFVMLGAGLLWFGWFGFNAGSAVGANAWASVAFVNTVAATAAAMIGWLITERLRDGHATSLGAASGVVAGLVAVTPAAGSVNPMGAMAIGVIAGVLCALAIGLKFRLGYDDSLDVVGVHLVGGLWGTIAIGLFATQDVLALGALTGDGLFYGGGADQLWKQVQGAGIVLVYSFVVTYIIGFLIHKTIGFRIDEEAEVSGIDLAEHAEAAYDASTGSGSGTFRPGVHSKAEGVPA